MDTPELKEQKLRQARRYFEAPELLLSPPIMRAAYSDRMAWILASMAQLVYERFEDGGDTYDILVAKLRGGGFEILDWFNDPETDTQAFLVRNKAFAVLAFRGTEVSQKKDIVIDARALKISIPIIEGKIKIHEGFSYAYSKVEQKIEESLTSKLGDLPLYITGHSLGAALATVATKNIEKKKWFRDQLAACYTFGSPRVGNKTFGDDLKTPIYRVANTTDIVTVVPTFGYRHVGDIRYLERGKGRVTGGIPIFERMLFFFRAILLNFFTPLVGDHAIAEYRKKIEDIAIERNIKRMGH